MQLAKSTSTQSDDIFGTTVNICSKINSNALPNGMIIGQNMYEMVKNIPGYKFESVKGYEISSDNQYTAYLLTSELKPTIINPFERISEL